MERIRTSLSLSEKEKKRKGEENRTKINFLLGGHVNDIFPFRARHDRNSIARPSVEILSSRSINSTTSTLRATRADFKATINSLSIHDSPSSPSSSSSFPAKDDSATVPRTRRMRRHISRSLLNHRHLPGCRVIPRLKFRARPRN